MHQFLEKLESLNLFLVEKEGDLTLKGRKGQLTKEEIDLVKKNDSLIAFIKENKTQLVAYLSNERVKERPIYKLSPLQEGMLFYGLLAPETKAYIEQFVIDFPEGVNVEALQLSWNEVVKNHSILRTSFIHDQLNIPVQCVYDSVNLPFMVLDYTPFSKTEQGQKIKLLLERDLKAGFDFSQPPLMRIHLIQTAENAFRMVWTFHHILLDGWSIAILMGEILSNYESFTNEELPKAKVEDKYEDYIQYINARSQHEAESFWKNYLHDFNQTSFLPFAKSTIDRNKGGNNTQELTHEFDEVYTEKIIKFAQRNKWTVNTLFQGIWSFLLAKYTGHENVVFGVTVSGRPAEMDGAEEKVGMYINTLPLFANINSSSSIQDCFTNIQEGHTAAREFQYTALSTIQEWANSKGDLFDSVMVFENFPIGEQLATKRKLKVEISDYNAQINILFSIVVALKKTLFMRFKYNASLLEQEEVLMIKNHFKQVLDQLIIANPPNVSAIDFITKAEKDKILHTFNSVTVPNPSFNTLVDLFDHQVKANPAAIALEYEEKQWTYSSLNERAELLAKYLKKEYQVQREEIVGILLDRSDLAIVSILGVLKAGAAYVPIDVSFPKERKVFIIEDTAMKTIICQDENLVSDLEIPLQVISIQQEWNDENSHEVELTPPTSNDLAYVIYTSGSTGKPKGVMIEHQAICNTMVFQIKDFGLNSEDRCLQFASLSFDASVWETFLALLSGARLCVVDEKTRQSPHLFVSYIKEKAISFATLPPVFLNELAIEELAGIKTLVTAGEAANLEKAKTFSEWNTYYNAYGPTESSVCATKFKVNPDHSFKGNTVPIGQANTNTQVYIIDENENLLPTGIVGELCIGGNGLARAYLNRPELTAEKFIENKFEPQKSARIYKTGDLARWLLDGNIEFLGRVDHQVKIRGFRIELDEIENVLNQSRLVKNASVLAKKDAASELQIVAYVVPRIAGLNMDHLIHHLQLSLPDYMIPSAWLELENLPLNNSGKVDKKALLKLNVGLESTQEYVAPRNQLEQQLADIWTALLKINQVGVKDDFFKIGGHSILAMRLISSLRKQMNQEFTLAKIFEFRTIEALAKNWTNGTKETSLPALVPVDRPHKIPLSYAQERLWFIDRLEGSVQYHMSEVLRLKNKLDKAILEEALIELIERHEVLRMTIQEEKGIPYQQVMESRHWQLTCSEVKGKQNENSLQNHIAEEINRPFDLAVDYRLRAHLLKYNANDHVLILVIHHIASDGWSQSILVKDLIEIYSAKQANRIPKLPALPIQYADFAIWQRNNITEDYLNEQLAWWEQQLNGVETLELPTDFPRQANQSTRGAGHGFFMDKKWMNQLNAIASENESSLFMTLLTCFNVLLYHYSGQKDICVGTPIANRDRDEVENLVGFFINTLALRTDLSGNPTFKELLHKVKSTTLDAFAHQEVPFEQIVNRVETNRSLSRTPIFQTLFVLQNNPSVPTLQLGDLSLSSEAIEEKSVLFDLQLSITESYDGARVSIEYCADLFSPAQIKRMADHFQQLIQSITSNVNTPIGALNILSSEEEHLVKTQFNDTDVDYPQDKTIVALFEAQVNRTPEQIAVVSQGKSLTFQALNEQSNQLAHYLRKKGVKEETLVAICVDRSLDMIVGLMGILKAGGAYVPIDPEYPQERINSIIDNAKLKFALSHKNYHRYFPNPIENIQLDDHWNSISKESITKVANDLSPENLMYVIYTSGSTGTPKGVMNQHNGLVNRLLWTQDQFQLNPLEDVILQKTTFCFDVSVWELFWPLISGVRMVMARPGGHKDSDYLKEVIEIEGVTTLHFVPSMLEVFLLDIESGFGSSLRRVLCSGEALKPKQVAAFKEKLNSVALHNLYGPTEAAIDVSHWPIPHTEVNKVSIGKPVANTQLYILNPIGQLCAIGVLGELHIGGIQVARGYCNRPDLTEKQFVENPFSTKPDAKMYKTGDWARWLPDGNIEYIGRMDQQVKIRGNRIELGEIEMVIEQSPWVKQSIVMAPTIGNEQQLVAYLISNKKEVKPLLQQFLRDRLPDYMVPALMLELDEFPLLANGKINRKILPIPDASQFLSNEYVAPRNEMEETLVNIWKELLHVERVGIYDNFFELGGHSLLIMRLASMIRETYQLNLPIKTIFELPTIAKLQEYLQLVSRKEDEESFEESEVFEL